MKQYIMFYEQQKGLNGYQYVPFTKYKVKKQDTEYYYSMGDKILKSELKEVKYTVDNINDGT